MFWFVFSIIVMFFSLSCCNNIHVNGLLLNFVLGGLNFVDQIYIEKYSIDKITFTYFL
jgi:hypothetical protein